MSDKPVNSQMNENDLKLPPLADTDGFLEEISSNLSSDSTSDKPVNENDLKLPPLAYIHGVMEKINNNLYEFTFRLPAGSFPAELNSEGPDSSLPAASSKSPASSHSVENPHDETLHTSASQDDRDEIILMLKSRKQELEEEMQGWTDYANEKVMQVTRKMKENQEEFKKLRQDREMKHRLEEDAKKQMSEMEQQLLYTNRTLNVYAIRARQLEEENFELQLDREAAKLEAIESAAKLQQALAKEKETLKKRDLMSAEKVLLRDQLNGLKSKAAELNNQIEKAKERRDQFKVLLKHEERETERIEEQIENLRIERKKDDALTEAKSDNIEQTGKRKMHKLQEEIKNLENTISKLKSETSKSESPALKGKAVLQDKAGAESRKRERECVMCLDEDRCVLFLPCKHQLLCGTCNEIHKDIGMNDCLTCKTVIEQRISVRFR